jgi:hypothetical protein
MQFFTLDDELDVRDENELIFVKFKLLLTFSLSLSDKVMSILGLSIASEYISLFLHVFEK